jgi:hypothetical protein
MGDRAHLIDELVDRLRSEGAPGGTWLIDLTQVRQSLRLAQDQVERLRDEMDAALMVLSGAEREADLLLERLQAALIRAHEPGPS